MYVNPFTPENYQHITRRFAIGDYPIGVGIAGTPLTRRDEASATK
jgi:hypothetical protein